MKISIIVPVYNVKEYLEQCVKSLVEQSYKNIEIILVDDGSTDGSGELCEQLAKKDKRIQVIHKKNGGLSDARNSGIRKCCGDYVLLVDSDDYVEKTLCEETIKIACETNADMVAYRARTVNEKSIASTQNEKDSTGAITVLSGYEAGERYLYGWGLQHAAWSKLYKRYLFDRLLFPKNLLAEDFATTYLYISFCKTVVIYDCQLYYYRVRSNSIMQQASLKLVLDTYRSACQKYEYEKGKYPKHNRIIETAFCNCLLKTIARIYNEKKEETVQVRLNIEEQLNRIDLQLVRNSTKFIYLLYKLNKPMFARIMKIIGKDG